MSQGSKPINIDIDKPSFLNILKWCENNTDRAKKYFDDRDASLNAELGEQASERDDKTKSGMIVTDLTEFEEQYFDQMPLSMICTVANGALYLQQPQLLDAAAERIARLIRGKTVEEIRKTFGVAQTMEA